MKIALGLGGVLLIIGSTLVTIAVLFPPKEYNGNRQTPSEIPSNNQTKCQNPYCLSNKNVVKYRSSEFVNLFLW